MDIILTGKDFVTLKKWLYEDIHQAKSYLKRHGTEEYAGDGTKITYYDIMKTKLEELEPLLDKINEQYQNGKINFRVK